MQSVMGARRAAASDPVADAYGIYVAVPFCRSKCSYCNFASGVFSARLHADYCRRLIREMDLTLAELAGSARDATRLACDSVYWGGGTPTLLPAEALAALAAALRERWTLAPDAEFTVEAAPGTLSDGVLDALLAAGVNRISLGVQSFLDHEARAVGRLHTRATVLADLARLRARGLANLNVDLIAGLPHQTAASWRESLAVAIDCGTPHVSVYLLEVDDDSRLGRELQAGGTRYHAHATPDDDFAADAYEMACAELERAGLRQYEISNFARPGYASRHNERYWLRRPYLGFGLEAHSMAIAAAPAGARPVLRWGNTDDLDEYMAALAAGRLPRREQQEVGAAQQREEALFLGLRRNAGVDLGALAAEFGAAPIAALEETLTELAATGLLRRESGRIALTPRGRLLANEVCARFV